MRQRSPSHEAIKLLRQFTGDAFTSKHGYDFRRPLNFGRRMAVHKYLTKIAELTAKPTVTYVPKRGEKSEVFEYTGQKGWRKFTVALVEHVDPKAPLEFTIDKSRPKGSRFVPVSKTTGQRYYHLPAKWFLEADIDNDDFREWLDTMGYDPDELDEGHIERLWDEYVIDTSAGDAELFLIKAGDSYMWSSGGNKGNISRKIHEIKERYGDNFFSPNNKNSHHYSNWFQGVTAFTDENAAVDMMREGMRTVREHATRYGRELGRWRVLSGPQYPASPSGHWTAKFHNGRMTQGPVWEAYETKEEIAAADLRRARRQQRKRRR